MSDAKKKEKEAPETIPDSPVSEENTTVEKIEIPSEEPEVIEEIVTTTDEVAEDVAPISKKDEDIPSAKATEDEESPAEKPAIIEEAVTAAEAAIEIVAPISKKDEDTPSTKATEDEDEEEVESSDDEHKDEVEAESTEEIDYHSLSKQELIVALGKLIKAKPVSEVKNAVEEIKSEFNSKFAEEVAHKKEEFLAEGGNIIDFHYSTPLKKEFNSLYFDYKEALSYSTGNPRTKRPGRRSAHGVRA